MSVDWQLAVRDPARVAAVERTGLFGTEPEDAFDRLTELAALAVQVSRSFVTLVNADQFNFKSAIGLPEGASRYGLIEQSFCRYVVGSSRPMVVNDAVTDPRTCDNPAIALYNVAAWMGFPIEDPNGTVLGTFCVVDSVPHDWSDRDIQIVATLARSASTEIERLLLKSQISAMHRAAQIEISKN